MSKFILVDNHFLFREGLKLFIEKEGIGQVIAEASNGLDFLEKLKTHKPDVVIMDIELPFLDGLEATKKALEVQPDLKVLILTMMSEKINYDEIINVGAMGFVLKSSGKKVFDKAIRMIATGEGYFASELLRQMIMDTSYLPQLTKPKPSPEEKLTTSEQEVLSYLCKGLTVSEIALSLALSINTVESYLSALLRKTQTQSTIKLLTYAIKNRIITA